jgi:hypothetical protein
LLLATIASGLGELGNCAYNFAHAITEVSKVALAFFRVGVVLFASVSIFIEQNLSYLVHGISECEELSLEVQNHVVHCAIVSLIEAETGYLEGKFVESAGLLHIEANLVEFAD